MIGIKKMFFLLILDLSYLQDQNVYFDIIRADVVYPPGEKQPIYLFLLQSKIFLMYIYNVEHPSQT